MNSNIPQEVAPKSVDSEATRAEPDWAAIRPVYEGDLGVTLEGICRRFGTNKRELRNKVEAEGWTLRRPRRTHRERNTVVRVSRPALISRMIAALERQITRLEDGEVGATDKEVALLGSMSKTLGKLIDLDDAGKQRSAAKPAASPAMTELRLMIARRIEQLGHD